MLVTLTLVMIAVCAGGCAGGAAGRSERNSYVREGETVAIRLITWEEWDDPAANVRPTYLGDAGERVAIELPPQLGLLQPEVALEAFRVREVAAAIVGAVVDFVKVRLEKEAAKHTQQFRQFTYADDFWKGPGLANYAAFELVRNAKGYDTAENPAFRMVCAIVPSRYDRRIVLLRPVYLKVNAAAAKVSPGWSGDRRLTIEVQTVIQGAGLDDKGGFEQRDLADATLRVPGYNLNQSPALYATFHQTNPAGDGAWKGPLEHSVAGYFRAPMPPITKESQSAMVLAVQNLSEARMRLAQTNPTDEEATKAASNQVKESRERLERIGASDSPWYSAHRGGAFRLYIAVTETDDSRARTTILEFAEFVGKQRDEAVNLARNQIDSP